MSGPAIFVGIISDTHGLVRPEALSALQNSDLIIHAGDIGSAEIVGELRRIAPTFAVRGNIDTQAWAANLPMTEVVEVGQLIVWVLHEISQLDLDPLAAGFAGVVFGHSHQPSIQTRDGVLYVNPGSAGPRRFQLPVTIARAIVSGQEIQAEIVELQG